MNILFDEKTVQSRIRELGAEITGYYRGKPLTVIVIMNGALIFGADLFRAIELDCWLDSINAASYRSHVTTGNLTIRSQLKLPVSGRHLLLVDEVLDSGITMKKLYQTFSGESALSIRSAVLVQKNIPRPAGLASADWIGFECDDRFLFGCGMDDQEKYRNMRYIAAID